MNSCENEMGVQIVEFNFHNKVIRLAKIKIPYFY